MTNVCVKALLSENRKALQGLHAVFGYNFQEPFRMLPVFGKFTIRSVYSALNLDKPKDCTIVLLIRDVKNNLRLYDDYRMLEITGDTVKIDFRGTPYYSYNLHTFCVKYDFENIRKGGNAEGFVIAQHKDYINVPETHRITLDMYARYNVIPSPGYSHSVRLVFRDGNGKKYLEVNKAAYNIDPSGYILNQRRRDWIQKAKALRAKRAQDAYKQRGSDEQAEELTQLVESRKKAIIDAIQAAKTSWEIYDVYSMVSSFRITFCYYESFIQKTKNREFTSISEAERDYKHIRERLQPAM